jgi:hypothetical protein
MSAFSEHILPPCRIYLTEGNIKTGEKTMEALLRLRDLMEIMKIIITKERYLEDADRMLFKKIGHKLFYGINRLGG